MRLSICLAVLGILAPLVARAEWLQASGTHFVVYVNDSERDAQQFAEQLERFHAALCLVTGRQLPSPSPSNRVTVYVVRSQSDVRKLYGSGGSNIGEFYIPRAGGSVAFVPRISTGIGELDFSMIMLLHEYSHHFLHMGSSFPMQRWYSEGAAEFFASASFGSDGSVGIGQPAQHRAGELFLARDVEVGELIQPETRKRKAGNDAFYGKSWLLFHYLTFSKERQGQLQRYLELLGQGRNPLAAGTEVFGDLRTLESELDAYLRKPRLTMLKLPAEKLQTGPVHIRRLTAGEAAILPVQLRSDRGVTREEARALLPEARAIAARFPEDPAVLAALSEAEHDAGNDNESIAAADAALARDPAQVNAYVQKGMSMFRLAADDPDPAAAYVRARAPFLALNRLETDHPLPLIYYYWSFTLQDKEPTPVAVSGLQRAMELAPFDIGLRMMVGIDQVKRGQGDAARRSLAPVAFNPHGGRRAAAAMRVLDRLEVNPQWDGKDVQSVLDADEQGKTSATAE
jgi:hypothetical protein